MVTPQTGNQLIIPGKENVQDPSVKRALEVIQRWGNTQVVNRITNPTSSTPILGRQGTGIVTVPSGSGPGTGAWTLISEQTVATSGDNVDFSAIPGTFRHLVLIGSLYAAAATGASQVGMQVNGIASLYGGWYTLSQGPTTFTYASATQAIVAEVLGTTDPNATAFQGRFETWLPFYANAAYSFFAMGQSSTYTRGYLGFGATHSVVSQPVTSIHLFDITGGGGFGAGGKVDLYGIS